MDYIKLGTSGFSFKDWKGVLYQDNIKPEKMFSVYTEYFDTVEINSTYYRIPPKRVFETLNDQTSDQFEFVIKLNKESTHDRKKSQEAIESLIESVSPMLKSEKLKGFLAQFPYSFKNTSFNRKYLIEMKSDCRDIPVIVEFRNKSWINDAVYDFLDRQNINYCCVDEPELDGLISPQSVVTGDLGYVRFHGKNSITWWDSSKGDRYDYLYSEKELSDWLQRIREIGMKSSKTYLFFNNCHAGHAVKNAAMMAKLLENQFSLKTLLKELPVN
ncbi:DUF72 domain-containing protein [candidate division KSB1 bacterium]